MSRTKQLSPDRPSSYREVVTDGNSSEVMTFSQNTSRVGFAFSLTAGTATVKFRLAPGGAIVSTAYTADTDSYFWVPPHEVWVEASGGTVDWSLAAGS